MISTIIIIASTLLYLVLTRHLLVDIITLLMGCFLCKTSNNYDDIEDENSCTGSCSNIMNSNIQKIINDNQSNKSLIQNIIKNPSNIYDVYFMDDEQPKILGEGQNGYVKMIIHQKSLRQFALKTIYKCKFLSDDITSIRNEIEIMSSIDHPNILKLYEYFETDDCIYLVLHLCHGGDLFERIINRSRLSEKLSAKYTLQMLSAIKYLHNHNIVHRDLKLENFLLDTNDDDCGIKLTDFGYSRYLDELKLLRDSVGTVYYASPEVFRQKGVTEKVDIWSIGVIVYMMLSGNPPFKGNDSRDIINNIQRCRYVFHSCLFRNVSNEAKDFIKSCLQVNPLKRPSATDLMKHSWFDKLKQEQDSIPNSSQKLTTVGFKLKEFEKKSLIIKTIAKVLAYTLNLDQMKELHKVFAELDKKRNGEISCNELKHFLLADKDYEELNFENLFKNCTFEDYESVKYTEFIAAILSKGSINESNFLLAFEKLSLGSNFITKDGICSLLGKDSSEEVVKYMFDEANNISPLTPSLSRISFDKFSSIINQGLE